MCVNVDQFIFEEFIDKILYKIENYTLRGDYDDNYFIILDNL